MRPSSQHIFGSLLIGLLAAFPASADGESGASTEAIDFFEQRIRPVLIAHCYECHSADAAAAEGDLLLDSRAGTLRGGQTGRVVVPGEPDASLLIHALRYHNEDLQMPPEGQLSPEIISDFERWIRDGAADPRSGEGSLQDSREERTRQHWAFQRPERAKRPSVRETSWPRRDIDFLILARLEAQELTPAPLADPRTQVRRLYYDLTGLPPSMDVVRDFEQTPSDAAFERLVDRLLATPQFGERWARYWLDLARFGDTKGYVFREDRGYPHAYKYRDWVIDALNRDLPYDEFLQLQIAADLESPAIQEDLAALGFLTLGRRFINNINDIIDDRIDVVSRGTMALTVSCARCHDHKYDPIPTVDYYGMYGIFVNSKEQQDEQLPLRLVEREKPSDVRVFLRGNPRSLGEVAPRGFVGFLRSESGGRVADGSGRRELAAEIVAPTNPLTARVFVNRVWAKLFDEPLVSTPSDFGLRSERPVQQDVLDHLAVTFVEDDWSVKRLVRRLVTSSTYRQQSQREPTSEKLGLDVDPENRLLWRAHRKRLDFEALRDSLLRAAGLLDLRLKGESVEIDADVPSRRRTLYAFIDRQNLPAVFRTFDFASPDTHAPQRPQTTVPQQALYLLNHQHIHRWADSVAERSEHLADPTERIRVLYQLTLSRDPTPSEMEVSQRFVQQEPSANQTGWSQLAQALLLTNEFCYLD